MRRPHTDELCGLLWRQWSPPTWTGADAAFPATAPSLHNPDFIDTVIHSYRHRRRLAEGDPRYDAIEERLAARPPIQVPVMALDGVADRLGPDDSGGDAALFTGGFEVRPLEGIGHNVAAGGPGGIRPRGV